MIRVAQCPATVWEHDSEVSSTEDEIVYYEHKVGSEETAHAFINRMSERGNIFVSNSTPTTKEDAINLKKAGFTAGKDTGNERQATFSPETFDQRKAKSKNSGKEALTPDDFLKYFSAWEKGVHQEVQKVSQHRPSPIALDFIGNERESNPNFVWRIFASNSAFWSSVCASALG